MSEVAVNNLSDEQQSVYNDILASRNGSIEGPFIPWLHSPELADRAQKLGAFCRFNTSLPAKLSELAILITAKHWRANVEWQIHAPIAENAGLSSDIIIAVRNGLPPEFKNEDEASVYALAIDLYTTKRVSKINYKRALNSLSERSIVELVGILGYYALVAMTLNVFEIEISDSGEKPFHD